LWRGDAHERSEGLGREVCAGRGDDDRRGQRAARRAHRPTDGTARKFDDLPVALRGNVNTDEAPYDRRPGDMPRLTETELDDLEAFLGTLTDGYRP
jgi:hypothetical protein